MKTLKLSTIIYGICFGSFFFSKSFASPLKVDSLKEGIYRAEILGDRGKRIPFQLEIKSHGGKEEMSIINADERLKTNQIRYIKDSVFIVLPFFEAEFRVKVVKEGSRELVKGYWVRHLPEGEKKYRLEMEKTDRPRFLKVFPATVNVTGLWDLRFDKRSHLNLGEFVQNKEGQVTGSILSVSGDDRFLEGRVSGDSLYLSTFDGAHAYLYVAKVNSQAHTLEGGQFYALNNPPSSFTGKYNPRAHLDDVYSLTSLKEGLDTLAFTFKNLEGAPVHYPNLNTHHKVTIIQFLGSWCPNCMDETSFLVDFYTAHKDEVSIVGLAYERSNDWKISQASVQKVVDRLNVNYPILITGFKNQPQEVMASLPALKNYVAFPTMIILDKKGKVRKIHTGFSGPGTGVYYRDFIKEFEALYKELNAEN